MIEVFTMYICDRMRGTADLNRPQDAGGHSHRKKWQTMMAVVSKPAYLAGLYFYLDLWGEFFGRRHAFCLGRSAYGNFAPGCHRHEMAVRAAQDSVFY